MVCIPPPHSPATRSACTSLRTEAPAVPALRCLWRPYLGGKCDAGEHEVFPPDLPLTLGPKARPQLKSPFLS